ncbi:peptidase M24, structural domain-containing protein [Pelagophyceae sp. CCMP2097]|nr:peptidase M24, structural domain-containing protein [Pelagophyceae sp. CCMP2097]|mmetsp:Transcript_2160/g.7687  ORF Transcript_2160/g.7687 Transcript_2160/m.7687 type:complete len:393 (-) Transcript_2160:102-1280(-)
MEPAESRECAGCGKAGAISLACPSCVKLKGSEPSNFKAPQDVAYFCEQACFKEHWAAHKAAHKPWQRAIEAAVHSTAMPPEFRGYDFTGPLRPVGRDVSRVGKLPAHISKPDYWRTGQPVSEQEEKRNRAIRVYTPKEIEGMRAVCQVGRQVLDAAGRAVKVGATTAEIDRVTFEKSVELGAYPSPLNYYDFPCSVCTSVNEVICHGIPDLRELVEGDVVNVDVSVYKDGFHGDLNETYVVGKADDASVKLVETAFKCLMAGAALVKPGTCYRDIGPAVDRIARAAGCSVVRTYCGHGIGELFHTLPNVPHYAKNKAAGIMKAGHIFTIEPMINMGVWNDQTWPDQWTAVTADGERSAQFEHTFLVTKDGCEILTARENEPEMVWDIAKQQR